MTDFRDPFAEPWVSNGTNTGTVSILPRDRDHELRVSWLTFGLTVGGCAVAGFCLALLGCYAIGRVVSDSARRNLWQQ